MQSFNQVQLYVTPSTAARQVTLSITNSQSLLKLTSTELVMPSNHLILCHPLSSCLQSFPASGSFPVSQFFASVGHSIGVSVSASFLLAACSRIVGSFGNSVLIFETDRLFIKMSVPFCNPMSENGGSNFLY